MCTIGDEHQFHYTLTEVFLYTLKDYSPKMQLTYTPKNYSPKMQLVCTPNELLTKNAATYYIYHKLIGVYIPAANT